MADYSKKKITDLTEKTAPSDSDLFVAGNNGTATMRKMSFTNIVSGIIGKLTGAVSSILTSNLTASRALISNSSGKVAASGVSSTELGYLSGASSNIQSQLSALNSKMGKYSYGFISSSSGKKITITCSNINAFWFPIFLINGGVVGLIITQGANMPAMSNIVGNMSTFLTITTINNGIELTITGNSSRGRMIFMAPDDVLNMLTVQG